MQHQIVPKTSGIYQIKNIVSRDSYVGSAANFRERFALHASMLNRGKHHSPRLQRAWCKYGSDAFEFIVLEELPKEKSILIEREQFFLDSLFSEYNTCGTARSMLGYSHTQESRTKIGQASKGRPRSAETRRKNSEATKRYLAAHPEKRPMASPEARRKRSAYLRRYWANRPVHHVQQASLEGVLIRIFENSHQAAQAVNCSPAGIRRCCRGERKTSAGYMWQYVK